LILIFGLLIYRVVVLAMFSNGGVNEKDVIIMTQIRLMIWRSH